MMDNVTLGSVGEAHVARELREVGLAVEEATGPADLVAGWAPAEGLAIEVKAAQRGPYRADGRLGYQFCLRRDGHTDARHADVLVLLCYYDPDADPVAFVIPTEVVGNRRKIVIPNRPWDYSGMWSRWYRSWEVVAELLQEKEEACAL
jgi:hypothetical protein